MSLRYPAEFNPDFFTISFRDYKGGRNPGSGPATNIVLPVPDLPNIVSEQKYGQMSGAFNNLLASGLREAYTAIDAAATNNTDVNIESIQQTLTEQVTGAGGSGPILRELAAQAAGSAVGLNGTQFQSFANGEVSNPQILLLYAGPTLRSYSFSWTLAPKSAAEAESVFQIIRTLKQAHLPSKTAGPGMLKVPKIFQLGMYVNGSEGRYYQKFFPSFMTAISVKQNSNGNHWTLPGGEPVLTTLQCVFKEAEIRTAEDFESNI